MQKLPVMTTIQNNIRRLIAAKNIQQKDLAADIEMKEANLSRLLNSDDANPTVETLERIAKYFGVTLCDLFQENLKKRAG